MRYTPQPTGQAHTDAELQRVAQTLDQPECLYLKLQNWRAAPARPSDGMVVFTDATAWNPGGGAGIYAYYGAAWNKL